MPRARRAFGNHLGLALGYGRQYVDGEPVRLREIDRFEVNFHEVGHERDVAEEPVELGDDALGPVNAARLEGFR
jgi:hypothetical protein